MDSDLCTALAPPNPVVGLRRGAIAVDSPRQVSCDHHYSSPSAELRLVLCNGHTSPDQSIMGCALRPHLGLVRILGSYRRRPSRSATGPPLRLPRPQFLHQVIESVMIQDLIQDSDC